jgi:hypothetical protein
MNADSTKEVAALLQAQRELKLHASLQPLISAVRHARLALQAGMEGGQAVDADACRAAIDAASEALKRRAAAPAAAADCVKKLHSSLSKLARSVEKSLPDADNVEATIPPLPPDSQGLVRQQLLAACSLSLATAGHVDAADRLASALRGASDGRGDDDCSVLGCLPPSFSRYHAASILRRRMQEGDVAAAAEVEALLQGGNHRLLLLKLHRAVVLHLLLSSSRDEPGRGEQQIKVPAWTLAAAFAH